MHMLIEGETDEDEVEGVLTCRGNYYMIEIKYFKYIFVFLNKKIQKKTNDRKLEN